MEIKDKIKKEIDQLPDELLYEVHKYLKKIKNQKSTRKRIRSIHLQGKYDNINIRQKAY